MLQTALTEVEAEVYASQGVLFISEIKTLKLDIMTEKVKPAVLLKGATDCLRLNRNKTKACSTTWICKCACTSSSSLKRLC